MKYTAPTLAYLDGDDTDTLASFGWLMQRSSSPGNGQGPALKCLDTDDKGRRARRHLGRSRASPYGRCAPRTAGPVYWSSVGEDDRTDEGEELEITRPPFSFTCLIGLAILKSNRTHISVGEVYKYILRNFPYFKTAKSTWRNSIRHVLSLGKYFCKRSRGSVLHEEVGPCVGKGSVWSVKGAMLPSLLQHITHGAKQLLPGTAAHLQLTDLSTTAAATAAATSAPATTPLPPLDLSFNLDFDLDALPTEGDGSCTSPVSECPSSDGWSSSDDFEVPDLGLLSPDLEGPTFELAASPVPQQPDWLERSMDADMVSALFEESAAASDGKLHSVDGWFASTELVARHA